MAHGGASSSVSGLEGDAKRYQKRALFFSFSLSWGSTARFFSLYSCQSSRLCTEGFLEVMVCWRTRRFCLPANHGPYNSEVYASVHDFSFPLDVTRDFSSVPRVILGWLLTAISLLVPQGLFETSSLSACVRWGRWGGGIER